MCRFVSEFGFQSFPSFPCYSAQTSAEDWAWDSDMSQHRYARCQLPMNRYW
jgi:hypothetical protein